MLTTLLLIHNKDLLAVIIIYVLFEIQALQLLIFFLSLLFFICLFAFPKCCSHNNTGVYEFR